MIIWGSYVTKKVIGTGNFYCPKCTTHRPYSLRRPKKWGHLYWIPLIPMEELERYVECDQCKSGYKEIVLQHDSIREQAEFEKNAATTIAQTMALMGTVSAAPPTIDAVTAAVRNILKTEPPSELIRTAMAVTDRAAALEQAAKLAKDLSSNGREMVLRAALAGPVLSPAGQELANEIGVRLGMSPAHISGVIAELRSTGV
jgi:hypothetical protein